MKFAYAISYVTKVSETALFYQNAFGFETKFITPEKDYAELVSGETTIAFAAIELGQLNIGRNLKQPSLEDIPQATEWAFTSENIDIDFQKALDNGASIVAPISAKPWGQKVGYLHDIDGHLIEICTPIVEK